MPNATSGALVGYIHTKREHLKRRKNIFQSNYIIILLLILVKN